MTEPRSAADQAHADAFEALVPAWLTVPEAADLLGVGVNRVRQLVTDRQLLAVRRDGRADGARGLRAGRPGAQGAARAC